MISVILPTYNSEKTLKRSVDSVINQKGSFKIELIIINDGSDENDYYNYKFPDIVKIIHSLPDKEQLLIKNVKVNSILRK